MKWGYSGYTKAETRRLVDEVKAKEELQSYIDDAEESDTSSINKNKLGVNKVKIKEF